MIGSRIHIRLFLDGVEVPVTSAQVLFKEGIGSQATVTIIPIDEIQDIKPRALVTLFYMDSSANDVHIQERPNTANDPSVAPKIGGTPTASIDEYKLLFMGEMVGISYLKRASGRAANLTCIDFLSYLDSIKMHGANFSHGGIEQIENAFQGAKLGNAKSTTATGKDLKTNIVGWLSDQKTQTQDGKERENIVVGMHRVLKEIFFSGNYFYAKAFNRLRLNDQCVGMKDDKTSINLFDLKQFKKFYDSTLSRQGSMISARQMLATLQAPIMYNYVTIPCPYLDEAGESRVYDTSKSSLAEKIISRSSYEGATLNQFVLKPDSWFFAPPSCNVIFPHMYHDFQISRDYSSETTRFILRTDDLIQGAAVSEIAYNYISGRFFNNVSYIKPKRMKDRLYAPDISEFDILTKTGAGKGYLSDLNGLLMTHEKYTGPVSEFGYAGALGQYIAKNARREYLGFFTDYMFWKYRFQGRTANVSMAFNPNIVPGFPAVILDRPLTSVEKAEGKHRKHFVGHVISVSHSISPQGVSTQVQLVAVRPYDESIDLDALSTSGDDDTKKGEGSSLERVAMGFDEEESYFDSRYSPENIGTEYYSKILGCDSIIDSFGPSLSLDLETTFKILAKIPGNNEDVTVAKAVLAISDIYDLALKEKSDLAAFTTSVTWRPKATMTQILGVGVAEGGVTSSNYPSVAINTEASADGFMASAVDPDSDDCTATYTSTEVTEGTSTVKTPTVVGQANSGTTGNRVDVVAISESQVATLTAGSGATATYGLDDELNERQARLKAYLEAIKHRGIRG